MRIKIISDGDALSTKIIDADNGEDITHQVKEVTWRVAVGKIATAELSLINVPVEVEAEVTE